jgi:hypothetical protein
MVEEVVVVDDVDDGLVIGEVVVVNDVDEVVVVMVASEMTETVLPPKVGPELATKTSPLEKS